MIYVDDIVKFIKENKKFENAEVMAILPDDAVVKISTQQYVEDGTYFMFTEQNDNISGIQTLSGLKFNLECEGSDSCWRPNCLSIFDDDGKNMFLDCDVAVVYDSVDNFIDSTIDDGGNVDKCHSVYPVTNIMFKDNTVFLICNEDSDEYEYSENEVHEGLTEEEKKLILTALNHFGDYVAERQGYSSGEKYWDLAEKLEAN